MSPHAVIFPACNVIYIGNYRTLSQITAWFSVSNPTVSQRQELQGSIKAGWTRQKCSKILLQQHFIRRSSTEVRLCLLFDMQRSRNNAVCTLHQNLTWHANYQVSGTLACQVMTDRPMTHVCQVMTDDPMTRVCSLSSGTVMCPVMQDNHLFCPVLHIINVCHSFMYFSTI